MISKTKSVSTMDAVECIQRADSKAEIAIVLAHLATRQGFEFCHIARASACDIPLTKKTIISFWPQAWFDQYDELRLVRHDPIAKSCKSSVQSFRWSDIHIGEDRSRDVMAVADQDFGMRDGFCVPFFGVTGYQGAVSFAGKHVDPSRHGDLALEVVAIYAFNRLNEIRLSEPAEKLLTARQREVLQWVAVGKTAWDTARILHICEDTVKKTIKAAMSRLNVHTRAHAIAEAVRLQEISF